MQLKKQASGDDVTAGTLCGVWPVNVDSSVTPYPKTKTLLKMS
jgi:hypothetical protein